MLLEWHSILLFLLVLTKWQPLLLLLRRTIALIILDQGFVVLAQISIPILLYISYYNDAANTTNPLVMCGIILYQAITYSAILHRLYNLEINNRLKISDCYIFGAKRFIHLLCLLILLAFIVAIFMLGLKNTASLLFNVLGVNFISNSLGVLIVSLLAGVFSFFTYFVFLLVVIEKMSPYQALVKNFKIMQRISISLLVQVTVLMILPGAWIDLESLPTGIVIYLWLLLGTSLSVVIYKDNLPASPTMQAK